MLNPSISFCSFCNGLALPEPLKLHANHQLSTQMILFLCFTKATPKPPFLEEIK